MSSQADNPHISISSYYMMLPYLCCSLLFVLNIVVCITVKFDDGIRCICVFDDGTACVCVCVCVCV